MTSWRDDVITWWNVLMFASGVRCAYTQTYMYAHIHIHVYVHIHIYVYIYVYIKSVHVFQSSTNGWWRTSCMQRTRCTQRMSCMCWRSSRPALNASRSHFLKSQLYNTGWKRGIGCFKLQVSFRKRATNYRALLRKMTCEDKALYMQNIVSFIGLFCKK